MIILACDPSVAKGFSISIFHDNTLLCYKTFSKDNNVLECATKMSNELKTIFPVINAMFIEDQYISVNAKTFAKLVEARTIAEIIIHKQFGCEIYRVVPTTWQKILSDKKIKSAERKKLSIEQAKKFANKDKMSEDEADAINIGRWAVDWLSKVTPEYRESCRYY